MLGKLLAIGDCVCQDVVVATKVNAWMPGCSLSARSCKDQCAASLKALGKSHVDVLYLHAPDKKTPIEDTLAAMQELFVEGSFKEFGLSNYSAEDVAYIYAYMADRQWVLPTVYQGLYNYLSRAVERSLFPVLRQLGIRFYAFNPLCGGLLTGKYTFSTPAREGRFVERKNYKAWYWKEPFFEALEPVRLACEEVGTPMVGAALRWLIHHSHLSASHGDAVIVGASSLQQLDTNLEACRSGPLADIVLTAIDAGWPLTEKVSRSYYQGMCLRSAPLTIVSAESSEGVSVSAARQTQ